MITKTEALQLLSESKISLITYSSIGELYKDEILSELNFNEIKQFDSQSSLKSILRDITLGKLLDNKKDTDFILLDLNEVKVSLTGLNRQAIVERLIRKFSSIDSEYKLIITGMAYKTMDESYSAPNWLLYSSYLVLGIGEGNTIKALKSRY